MNGSLRTACRRYCERAQSHGDENQKPPHSLLLSPAEAGFFWTSASRPRDGPPVGATLLFCGKNVKLLLSAVFGLAQLGGVGFEPTGDLRPPAVFKVCGRRPLRSVVRFSARPVRLRSVQVGSDGQKFGQKFAPCGGAGGSGGRLFNGAARVVSSARTASRILTPVEVGSIVRAFES